MNRHVRVNVHSQRFQLLFMLCQVGSDGFGRHSPRQAGISSEGFDVDKVAPAANGLTDQKSACCQIYHRQCFYLADLAHQ